MTRTRYLIYIVLGMLVLMSRDQIIADNTVSLRPDHVTSLADAVGSEVAIYQLPLLVKEQGKCVYKKNEKGKLKTIKDKDLAKMVPTSQPFVAKVVSIENNKGKDYAYLVGHDGREFYLELSPKFDYSSFILSLEYYDRLLTNIKKDAKYLIRRKHMPEDLVTPSDQFAEVIWSGFSLPSSPKNMCQFNMICDGVESSGTWEQLKGRHEFVSQVIVDDFIARHEKAMSERDMSPISAMLSPGTCNDTIDGRIPIYLYEYDPQTQTYTGRHRNSDKKGQANAFKDFKPDDATFLRFRTDKGKETRRRVAMRKDSLATAIEMRHIYIEDSIRRAADREAEARIQAFINQLKTKQLFFVTADYSYSTIQCGLKVTLFNCFNKTIKYIHFTFTSYNAVMDVQRDYLGRYTANAKGIGPVSPGEFCTYDFDELFWDERDIIEYIYVTGIKFEFMDGTMKSFTGRKVIQSHCWPEEWIPED